MLQSLFILLLLLCIANGLLPVKPITSRQNARGMTMYFDDVSRSIGANEFDHLPSHAVPFSPSSSSSSYHAEKVKAIHRMLHGIDSTTASTTLTDDQVLRFTEQWACRSGVIPPQNSQDEQYMDQLNYIYQHHVGSHVVNATAILDCLAGFWKIVASHRQDHSFLRSKQAISFIVFPNCRELYHYATMYTFVMALQISFAAHQQKQPFELTLFHPHYKNAPVMLSPERHAPFPIVGLECSAPVVNEEPREKRQNNVDDDLDQIKKSLEAIFSSPAAAPHTDANLAVDDSFPREKGTLTATHAKTLTQTWIQKSKANNSALAQIDSVQEWNVSERSSAASAYAQIWQMISDLKRLGQERGKLQHDRASSDPTKQPIVTSSVLISTQFCRYNAQAWKQFAITVNAALRRLCLDNKHNETMYLQVFHPEYVGDKTRRSPLPMIQVCYKI